VLVLGIGLVSLACGAVSAEPARQMRVILPFSAGGVSDLVARIVFTKYAEQSKQQVVIDNRPGGAGNIATEAAVRAPTDGSTVYMADPTGFLAANVTLFPKTPFNVAVDLAPVVLIGTTRAVVVVSSKTTEQSIGELVAAAKRRPGDFRYGSTGIGSPGHLNGELFKRLADVDITHVPYRLIPQGTADLISGQISLWFGPIPTFLSFIRGGQMRALAVSGETRSADLPEVPTVREAGLGEFDASTMYALYVPAGTPREIIDRIRQDTQAVVGLPDVDAALRRGGVEPRIEGADFLARTLNDKIRQWAAVITKAGIRADGQ
jgi:tripartite-type tricarboxylate transporter receptor subunit TctC